MAISTTISPAGGQLPRGASVVGGIVLDLIGSNGQRVLAQLGAGANLYKDTPGNLPTQPDIIIGTQDGLTPAVLAALGGGLSKVAIRVTLFDGDTSIQDVPPIPQINQDYNENTLLLNELNFGNWSPIETLTTDSIGNVIAGTTSNIGFFNQELDTGWFIADDPALLSSFYASLVSTGEVVYKLRDSDPGDNFRNFQEGLDSSNISGNNSPKGVIIPVDLTNSPTDTLVQFDFTPAVNRDVIVNTSDTVQDPINTLQQDYVTQSVATAVAAANGKGLPDNGFFPANAFHPAIQLAYRNTDNGNNAWVATSNGQGVNLDIPDAKYSEIHVAAAATDGAATMQATLIYTDGTQAIATADVPDWQDELTAQSPSAYYLIDAMDTAQPNGTFAQADDPALFGFRFTPDSTRTLQSITLTKTGGIGRLNVFGATGVSATDIVTNPITKTCANGTPLPAFSGKLARRLEVLRLDNALNTLTLDLKKGKTAGLGRWEILQTNSPKFAKAFNSRTHSLRSGYRVFGRKGNDVIEVKKRENILNGNGGNDTISGGQRRDLLNGGPGSDVINGNIGRDIFVGGGGNDTLTGGFGIDMFSYKTVTQGTDLIKDFTPEIDVIDLRTIFKKDAFKVSGKSFYERLNQFVRLVETGGSTQVQIDADGKGAGTTFNTLAVLEGISSNQLTSCSFVV
jgi:Ca2+-binding RTX toxin-like protein